MGKKKAAGPGRKGTIRLHPEFLKTYERFLQLKPLESALPAAQGTFAKSTLSNAKAGNPLSRALFDILAARIARHIATSQKQAITYGILAHPEDLEDTAERVQRVGTGHIDDLERLPLLDAPWFNKDVDSDDAISRSNAEMRLQFNALIESHTWIFGGRETEIQATLNHLENVHDGYVFIEGLSGYGKTSFLARLVHDNPSFVYHFISQLHGAGNNFDPAEEGTLIENICEQIAVRGVRTTTWNHPRLRFAEMLQNAGEQEQQLVIVIDAIDEVNGFPNFLDGLLPAKLPRGVTVILSARSQGDRNYLSEVGLRPSLLSLRIQLLGFTVIETQQVLEAADGEARRLATNSRFVEKLHDVSNGDPFYLRFLVEDIAAKLITENNVAEVPSGLHAYFDQQLAQLDKSAHLRLHHDIIGQLLEDETVSRSELILMDATGELDELNFDSVVRDIQRFLITKGKSYSLCHRRFQEYLKDYKW